MFRHCIAGVDFSAGWDRARDQLTRILPLLGIGQLTLFHADEPHHRTHKEANACANRRTHLEQLAKDMAESLAIPTEPAYVSGFAASSLLEIATRRQAGLILVANNSHSRGQDFFMGNVALDLARQSRLPLLIIPVDLGPIDDNAPLLLVTDHSPASTRARACFTELLGSKRSGRVMIVNNPEHQLDFEELKAEEGFTADNERLDIGVVLGDPVDDVCDTASELKTPLIVIGKHGSPSGNEPPLGSVAEGICRRAANPLLLIPS
ncbi:universal stress protein [Zobellella maritima]|uniref:universal stress protein n=1 Tax=Zobellella maritima TaxID=2059725 RepID=UPI000E30A8B2|nr:universal stress protein [Zobellella maritima]